MNTPVTFDFLRSQWPLSAGSENLSMRAAVQRLSTDDALFLTIPDYQRSVVWTDRQCALFIGFIAEGGKAPPIFVQRWDSWLNKPDEIIDGLQRLTAIRRFMTNEVPMELADGRQAYLRDFSEDDQRRLTSHAGPTLVLQFVSCPTRADVLRLYIRLNRGGTPHTDAEIARVQDMLLQA